MTTVIKDVVTWLKQWFYTESEVDTITGGLQTQINNKADSSTVSSLATTVNGKADSTHTHGNLQSDGKVGTSGNASKNVVTDANGKITTEAKPTIPSASSTTPSADTTSGSYGSGTSYARSNHTHPKSSLYAEASHQHSASDVYTTNSVTVESEIDDIKDSISELSSIEAIKIVTTLPTASANTMGKLYIISENSKVNVYYTERSGTSGNYTYTWHKMDTDILDELSISWNDITDKPTIPSDVSQLSDNQNTAFTPKAHTHSEYVNPTIADNLTTNDATKVLSAKQGKVLQDNKAEKTATLGTTITLIDKGETNEGCIVFNTIS